MSAFIPLLLILVPLQDEPRLRDAWPRFVEAWKAAEAYPAAGRKELEDAHLKVTAKVHAAFESAGLFAADGEYAPRAIKELLRIKTRGLTPPVRSRASSQSVVIQLHAHSKRPKERSTADLLADLQKEEEIAIQALSELGLVGTGTTPGLRRRVLSLSRALVKGEPFPRIGAPADGVATEIRKQVARLSQDDIEGREQASRALLEAGEPAIPFLREAGTSSDSEAASRARRLLGYGHAPWDPVENEVKIPPWGSIAESIWKVFLTDEGIWIDRIDIIDALEGAK